MLKYQKAKMRSINRIKMIFFVKQAVVVKYTSCTITGITSIWSKITIRD